MQARRDILARIAALDSRIRAVARRHATVRLLMTAPGVGPITAMAVVAVVVRVDPSGMTATQTQLEELWPAVATAVREMCSDDQSLGGLVASARALSADAA